MENSLIIIDMNKKSVAIHLTMSLYCVHQIPNANSVRVTNISFKSSIFIDDNSKTFDIFLFSKHHASMSSRTRIYSWSTVERHTWHPVSELQMYFLGLSDLYSSISCANLLGIWPGCSLGSSALIFWATLCSARFFRGMMLNDNLRTSWNCALALFPPNIHTLWLTGSRIVLCGAVVG